MLYHVRGQDARCRQVNLDETSRADIAASFQQAVVDVLVGKTILALQQQGLSRVILGGGVSANSALRQRMADACRESGAELFLALPAYCTDNAAMVAGLAYHKLKANLTADLSLTAHA